MNELGYLLNLETNTLPTHFIMTFSHPAPRSHFVVLIETAIEAVVLDTLVKTVGAAHANAPRPDTAPADQCPHRAHSDF